MMSQKNISGKKEINFLTSDDLLGKKVLDSKGNEIGLSEKIFIDPITFNLTGIQIDKGFLKTGFTISKNYIERVTPHVIFLKTYLLYNIKGMTVFDSLGRKIGIVSKIILVDDRNELKELEVKSNVFKKTKIYPEYIETIGENVILNVKKQDL